MDDIDDILMAELRGIAQEVDPVPETVRAAARAAITTREIDRQLAVLVGDSTADADAEPASGFAAVRAAAPAADSRMLSFAGGGVQVDVEVSRHGEELTLIGMLAGASTEDCLLEYGDGRQRRLDVDAAGRFLLGGLDTGPVRLRCRTAAGDTVTTEWVVL